MMKPASIAVWIFNNNNTICSLGGDNTLFVRIYQNEEHFDYTYSLLTISGKSGGEGEGEYLEMQNAYREYMCAI